MEWTAADIFKVINLYRHFDCLWNIRSKSYKQPELRCNAWQRIAMKMKKDIGETKKKIKHLRTTYVVEKKKVDAIKKSGSLAANAYIPRLFYYNKMKFLDAVVVSRTPLISVKKETMNHATKALDVNSLTENRPDKSPAKQSAPINCPPLPSLSPPANLTHLPCSSPATSSLSSPSGSCVFRTKKLRRDAKRKSTVNTRISSLTTQEPMNVFTSFGNTIALQLQQLHLFEATKTMSEIHNYITKKILSHLGASETDSGHSVHESQDVFKTSSHDADIDFY